MLVYTDSRVIQQNLNSKGTANDQVMCTCRNVKLVTDLQHTCINTVVATCYQDVFALLVPNMITCQRLVGNLLCSCRSQQACYELFQQLVIRPAIQ